MRGGGGERWGGGFVLWYRCVRRGAVGCLLGSNYTLSQRLMGNTVLCVFGESEVMCDVEFEKYTKPQRAVSWFVEQPAAHAHFPCFNVAVMSNELGLVHLRGMRLCTKLMEEGGLEE